MEILHQLESGDEIVTLEKGGRAGRKKKVSTYMVDVPNKKMYLQFLDLKECMNDKLTLSES